MTIAIVSAPTPIPAALPSGEPRPWRWTRDDYHRLADAGFFQGQRVQLIQGEIVVMSPQNVRHQAGIMLGLAALQAVFGAAHVVRCQLPLDLGTDSAPEPDLAVVAGPIRAIVAVPTTALLVVEIADTTLAFDRLTKAGVYASAGIAEYWIVNLIDRCLEVHRDPLADPAASGGHRYATVSVHPASETVSPVAAPTARVAVADLLP